jgi:hypothetical protein
MPVPVTPDSSVVIQNGATAVVVALASLQLQATVTEYTPTDVAWSILSGSGTVNPSTGKFTSPEPSSSDRITVVQASAAEGQLTDTITITTPAEVFCCLAPEVGDALPGGGTMISRPMLVTGYIGYGRVVTVYAKDGAGNPLNGVQVNISSSDPHVALASAVSSCTKLDGSCRFYINCIRAGSAVITLTSGAVTTAIDVLVGYAPGNASLPTYGVPVGVLLAKPQATHLVISPGYPGGILVVGGIEMSQQKPISLSRFNATQAAYLVSYGVCILCDANGNPVI